MSYRYILRYYIQPNFHEEERISELVQFCLESKIAEVMLFYNAEESYRGYDDDAEEQWIKLAQKVKAALNASGIEMSVNPWTTLGHLALGRRLPAKMKSMHRMVGETGVVSQMVACPLDETWRTELSRFFGRIAAEVAPTTIWIEDDWRLHNHGTELGYGGCFCEEHLRRTAKRLQLASLTREELLTKIHANDFAARDAWMLVCDESLTAAGKRLYQAVHKANPAVRLGLMRSLPDYHSIEGADWQNFKETFSPDAPLQIRPHLPPYTENYMVLALPEVARQTVSEYDSPEQIVPYPEMESSPRSGFYSKSAAVVAWESLTVPLFGSQGITVNHFDMMGNGISLDRHVGKKLGEIKPRLDRLQSLGCTEENAEGVNILYHPDVAKKMPVRSQEGDLGLHNRSISWGFTCGILGISHKFVPWKRFDPEQWNALSGFTAAALSDEEIEHLLSGKLLLDAESVLTLVQRGFGKKIGVLSAEMKTQESEGYAYEEILEPDPDVYGLSNPRLCAQRVALRALKMETEGEILTQIRRYDDSILSPGFVRSRNGRYLLSAWPMGEEEFFMAYFNEFRRIFLQRTLASQPSKILFGGDFLSVVYCNHLASGDRLLAIGNPTHDAAEQIRFKLHGIPLHSLAMLQKDGTWAQVPWEVRQDGSCVIPEALPPMEFAHLLIRGK